jgi:high-affinity nickel-transport protein
METLHGGIYPLVALAFVLGMKHGMDADHLATIDGLTRFNAAAGRKKLARLCGFLFSLGHGVVVCIVAVGTSFLFQQGAVPAWMDEVGAWVSAFFLPRMKWCRWSDSRAAGLVNSGTRAILC